MPEYYTLYIKIEFYSLFCVISAAVSCMASSVLSAYVFFANHLNTSAHLTRAGNCITVRSLHYSTPPSVTVARGVCLCAK